MIEVAPTRRPVALTLDLFSTFPFRLSEPLLEWTLSAMGLSGGTIVVSEMGSASPGFGRDRGPGGKRKKAPWGSAQVFEKAQFRQENPRKSKPFSLMVFGRAWVDFAGFG
jgi:hypothetical protein